MQLRLLTLVTLGLLACGDSGATPQGGGGTGAGSSQNGGAAQGAGGPGGGSPQGGGGTGAGSSGGGGAGGEDPWAGPVVDLKELDLGTAEIGDTLRFDLPDRMIGLTTLSETAESGLMGVASLKPPLGSSVVFNFAIPTTNLAAFIDEGALNSANPQSDLDQAWPLASGQWQLRLASDETPTMAHSRVWVRRTEDGAFHGGVVDFHVFIASVSGADQGYVQAVLNAMFANHFTPDLGLTLGTVSFATISTGLIGSHDEYRQLLQSSAGAGSAPAVNLFVVGDFGGDIDSALGIAGGIPGSPMVHGTTRSGVAYTPTGNGNYDATVLAHEIGHLAGLFHTSEIQTVAFDPLGDTPTCPNISSGNPNNCPDVSNVMFPIAYGGSILTPLQARVVQGSAIYRGILTAGGSPSGPLPLPVFPSASQREHEHELLREHEPEHAFQLPSARPLRGTTALERALESHWCARAGDVEAWVWDRLGAGAREELTELVRDATAFDLTRARALSMLTRFATTEPEIALAIELADELAAAPSTGRRASIAAGQTLHDLGAPARDPSASIDPVVRARLQALAAR